MKLGEAVLTLLQASVKDADAFVSRAADGHDVDDLLMIFRALASADNEELSGEAQERLALTLAARARYRS